MSDFDEIVRLTHTYALLNDTFRVDELMELFVEDADFDMRPAGLDLYEGKAAIRDFFERERRAMSHLMHVTSNHIVDFESGGDRAKGTAYFLAMGITRKRGVENHARGYYGDEYVRTSEGWRFQRRSSNLLLPFEPLRRDSASR